MAADDLASVWLPSAICCLSPPFIPRREVFCYSCCAYEHSATLTVEVRSVEKMLSKRTVDFLEELADSSHLAYPEGGLLFRYQYAYKQAHCCLRGDMRDALHINRLTGYSEVTGRVLNDLARFFQSALGDYTNGTAMDGTVLVACNLIDYLKEDLQNDLIELVVEDGDYGMTATFEMASKSRNDYSRLELLWSVD